MIDLRSLDLPLEQGTEHAAGKLITNLKWNVENEKEKQRLLEEIGHLKKNKYI